MPTMIIRVINSSFASSASGTYDTLDDAYRAAITAGLEIAATEIVRGALGTIVQVAVDVGDRRDAARGAVAISTTRFVDYSTANTSALLAEPGYSRKFR